MSETTIDEQTAPKTKGNGKVKTVGVISIIVGIVMMVAGAITWVAITDQLSAENIVVSEDADRFAGAEVAGPLTAFEQAAVINKHALEATDGKTYADLDREDPLRDVAMNASFLRASLFTSVVAYGVAAFAAGMGLMLILMGLGFVWLAAPAKE